MWLADCYTNVSKVSVLSDAHIEYGFEHIGRQTISGVNCQHRQLVVIPIYLSVDHLAQLLKGNTLNAI